MARFERRANHTCCDRTDRDRLVKDSRAFSTSIVVYRSKIGTSIRAAISRSNSRSAAHRAVVDLVAERIDVAVRLGLLADSTLIAQQLLRTHYAVCASPDYLNRSPQLKHPMDLEQHNCLLFPLSGFRSRWIFKDGNGELIEVPVAGRTMISSAIALGQCAIAGMGLALLPNWLIEADLQAGNLVDVFPDYAVTARDFDTAAWLVYPARAYVPLKVRKFIEFLKKSISG